MNNNITTEYTSNHAIINLPHTKYLDKILRSNSYEELMWRFKDAESPSKEITESYAAFSCMKKICQISNFNWLHIGDGGYTRTAAIFAFLSKTNNVSIDPALNIDKFNKWLEKFSNRPIRGIIPIKKKFQDTILDDINLIDWGDYETINSKPVNITCVHAHVNLEEVDTWYPYWYYLYTNPCCNPEKQTFSEQYMKDNNIIKIMDKINLGILSDKRQCVIYKNLNMFLK